MLVIKLGSAIFKWQNWIWTKDYLTSSSAFMITSPRQELKEEGLKWFWEDIQNNKIRQIHCREWRGSSWLEIRERGHISIYILWRNWAVSLVSGVRGGFGEGLLWEDDSKEGLCFMVEQKILTLQNTRGRKRKGWSSPFQWEGCKARCRGWGSRRETAEEMCLMEIFRSENLRLVWHDTPG